MLYILNHSTSCNGILQDNARNNHRHKTFQIYQHSRSAWAEFWSKPPNSSAFVANDFQLHTVRHPIAIPPFKILPNSKTYFYRLLSHTHGVVSPPTVLGRSSLYFACSKSDSFEPLPACLRNLGIGKVLYSVLIRSAKAIS